MSARDCFTGKMAAGLVPKGAGERLMSMVEQFQREHEKILGGAEAAKRAAEEAASIGMGEAAVKADQIRRTILAQADALDRFKNVDTLVRKLRATVGDWGFGNKAPPGLGKERQTTLGFAARSILHSDPFDLTPESNIFQGAKFYRGRAHQIMADTFEALRPKNLGFTEARTHGLDLLRALYGRADGNPNAPAWAESTKKAYKFLADEYRRVGGQLGELPNYRINNAPLNVLKARSIGAEAYKALIRRTQDRELMIDYATKKPMTDARFERFVQEHAKDVIEGTDDVLSGAVKGQRMLANSRDYHRVLHFKSPEAWMEFAETVGEHADVFQTIVDHIHSMSQDIAILEHMGPNPQAFKRFVLDAFEREPARLRVEAPPGATAKQIARAVKENQKIQSRVTTERHLFEALFDEVTGANKSAVNPEFAQRMGDIRSWLSSAQLGTAMIASLTDPGSMAIAARYNGLPVMKTINDAVAMMAQKGSETRAAQHGLIADTLIHTAGGNDRITGETIRTGIAGKFATANMRLSGLRAATAFQRNSFGLEWMAHAARERSKPFAQLDPQHLEAFDRYGITEADWDVMRSMSPVDDSVKGLLIRPVDLLEAGHRKIAQKYDRLINSEMDHAVIEYNPQARALIVGQSRPGTAGGEVRRGVGMYQSFTTTFMLQQYGRALARGWDGSRLGHAALTFITMTGLGVLSMQSKEILAGRDPLSLDPTTRHGLLAWGKGTLQGGSMGKFGDIITLDQTRYGNSWASFLAGPQFSAAESILGDFLMKNVQASIKGQETHFLGEAAYTAGRFVPGSTLWFARAAFQRNVLDQLALMTDERAPARFRRMEDQAQKEWGQRYWYRPGRTEPSRAPDFGAIAGR
jgi:hypothetical protein